MTINRIRSKRPTRRVPRALCLALAEEPLSFRGHGVPPTTESKACQGHQALNGLQRPSTTCLTGSLAGRAAKRTASARSEGRHTCTGSATSNLLLLVRHTGRKSDGNRSMPEVHEDHGHGDIQREATRESALRQGNLAHVPGPKSQRSRNSVSFCGPACRNFCGPVTSSREPKPATVFHVLFDSAFFSEDNGELWRPPERGEQSRQSSPDVELCLSQTFSEAREASARPRSCPRRRSP